MEKKKFIAPELIIIRITEDEIISCSGPFDPYGLLEEDPNDIIDMY